MNIRNNKTLFKIAKWIKDCQVPSIKYVHLPLFYIHKYLIMLTAKVLNCLWFIPLFKARCRQCGKGLRLHGGMPYVRDNNLVLIIGSDVSLEKTSFTSNVMMEYPFVRLGDNVHISKDVDIVAYKLVDIGDNCMIAKGCYITDTDSHPTEPEKRLRGDDVHKDEPKPVTLERNVWLGVNCIILKGVTIGENSVIGAGSVVRKNVPPNSVVMGPISKHLSIDVINKIKEEQK